MCTIEAPIHVNIKQAIVDAQETDTELVLRRWKNTSRLFKNKMTEQATKVERESTTGKFEEVQGYVSGQRGKEVFVNGDKDYGVWTAGQVYVAVRYCYLAPNVLERKLIVLAYYSIGLIHDIPTCADLIQRIEREAEETLRRTSSLLSADGPAKSNPQTGRVGATAENARNVQHPGTQDGKVGKNDNNPEAQLWGIGEKSKL